MKLMRFITTGIAILQILVCESRCEDDLKLNWIDPPEAIERGFLILRFNLENQSGKDRVFDMWVRQNRDAKSSFPNVKIIAVPKSNPKNPRAFNPYAPYGQIPRERKTITSGSGEKIEAALAVNVPDGMYEVWAELRAAPEIRSPKITMTVKGGKVVGPRQL